MQHQQWSSTSCYSVVYEIPIYLDKTDLYWHKWFLEHENAFIQHCVERGYSELRLTGIAGEVDKISGDSQSFTHNLSKPSSLKECIPLMID